MHDVLASLNARELAQRRFREIARVSGLVFQGYPGAHKSARQLQAGLIQDLGRHRLQDAIKGVDNGGGRDGQRA